MKKLTCEMCGSTELVKEDGVFVCQSCGTKYSVEEAKKMMVEGTVEVVGTVKIDSEDDINSWEQNARNAKQRQDLDDMEKYYNLIKDKQPDNLEAIFYSAYAIARKSLSDLDLLNREREFQKLTNAVKTIKPKVIESKNIDLLISISKDIKEMILNDFKFNLYRNQYGIAVGSDKEKTIDLFNELNIEFINLIIDFADKYNNVEIYKMIIEHCQILMPTKTLKLEFGRKQIEIAYQKIKMLDSSYEIPVPPKTNTATDINATVGATITFILIICIVVGLVVFLTSM